MISCRKDLDLISTSQWKPELALPFIQADFNLEDIIGSDTNLHNNPDSSFIYVYAQDSVILLNIDSIFTAPDNINGSHDFPIGEITFDEFEINRDFNLIDLLPYVDKSVSDTLTANNGFEAVFPAFTIENAFTVAMDPVLEYLYLDISEGSLELAVENRLPVMLQDILLEIRDVGQQNLIKEVSITELAAGELYTGEIILDGMTISNHFELHVQSLSSPGSDPETVPVSLEDGLTFSLSADEIRVVSGMGSIEEQLVIIDTCIITIETDGQQLFHIDAGELTIISSLGTGLETDVAVEISLPSALVKGEVPSRQITVQNGNTTTDNWNVQDISLDLTTGADPFNSFPVIYRVTLLPTTGYVSFDSSYRVRTGIELNNMEITFADGFLGRQEVSIGSGSMGFDLGFLEQLKGTIILDDPEFTLEYRNSFGIPLKVKANILGKNSETQEEQMLDADSLELSYPGEPGNSAEGTVTFNKENSSIVELLAVRPDQIGYDLGGLANWNDEDYNFIGSASEIIIDAKIEIPLVLRSNNLHFTDTVKIEMPESTLNFSDGEVVARVTNGFPFDMKIYLMVPDALTGEVLETLDFNTVSSAPVDGNGRVTGPNECESVAAISETFFQSLERAEEAILLVEAITFNNGNVPVALYSDYMLDVAIGFELAIKP